MSKVAFIGLGNMGIGMATNLVKGGHEVIAFDVSDKAKDAASAAGCRLRGCVLCRWLSRRCASRPHDPRAQRTPPPHQTQRANETKWDEAS